MVRRAGVDDGKVMVGRWRIPPLLSEAHVIPFRVPCLVESRQKPEPEARTTFGFIFGIGFGQDGMGWDDM